MSDFLKRIFCNTAPGQDTGNDGGGAAVIDAPPPVLDTVAPPATPPMYAVLLQNDDTTMPEFVILVLMEIFAKSKEQSMDIMMTAHTSGEALVTIVSRDMAETMVAQTKAFIDVPRPGKSIRGNDAPCELTFTCVMETPGDST